MEKRKSTILWIDDYAAALEASKELLEISGYEVLTAQSGEEGLGLFHSRPIDAVVLDYQLPGMNGARVASQMRRVKPHVPILMLSGYSELPLNERFDSLGSSVSFGSEAYDAEATVPLAPAKITMQQVLNRTNRHSYTFTFDTRVWPCAETTLNVPGLNW